MLWSDPGAAEWLETQFDKYYRAKQLYAKRYRRLEERRYYAMDPILRRLLDLREGAPDDAGTFFTFRYDRIGPGVNGDCWRPRHKNESARGWRIPDLATWEPENL